MGKASRGKRPRRTRPTTPGSGTSLRPCRWADRLFEARDAGATEQQLQRIAAEGLAEVYFRAGNTRATGLGVEFTDMEHIQIEL